MAKKELYYHKKTNLTCLGGLLLQRQHNTIYGKEIQYKEYVV